MTSVKIGQVWQDKDKRRNTRIEILSIHRRGEGSVARALIVGTEQEREYSVSRLTKRWELVADKAEKLNEAKDEEVALSEAAEAVRDGKAKLTLTVGKAKRSVLVPERTRAKQPVYQLKLVSPTVPEYKLRMTQKMLDDYGYPTDPWGDQMELA